jgi:hypothetical protein
MQQTTVRCAGLGDGMRWVQITHEERPLRNALVFSTGDTPASETTSSNRDEQGK